MSEKVYKVALNEEEYQELLDYLRSNNLNWEDFVGKAAEGFTATFSFDSSEKTYWINYRVPMKEDVGISNDLSRNNTWGSWWKGLGSSLCSLFTSKKSCSS